jgi:hypothetical protein
MDTVRAPSCANLGILIAATVLPVALILGLVAAFGGYSVALPVSGSIGMVIVAVLLRRQSIVEVSDSGITLKFSGLASRSLFIPWSDVESAQGHYMSLRVVRRSTSKRLVVQIFCSDPLNGLVGRAIRDRLETPREA